MRQHWLWVTRPEYYLDELGQDTAWLDPELSADAGGTWTCDKRVAAGDLVLLYRTTPKRDIRYLIQCESDSFRPPAHTNDSDFPDSDRCEYRVLKKFNNPLTLDEIRNDDLLAEWSATKLNFARGSFLVPSGVWNRLRELIDEKDRNSNELQHEGMLPSPGTLSGGLSTFETQSLYVGAFDALTEEALEPAPSNEEPTIVSLERELRDHLAVSLGRLKEHGFDLEIYHAPDGIRGVEFPCGGICGFIDLLCIDRSRSHTDKQRFVVIELKVSKATYNTLGQVLNYVGWVQRDLAGPSDDVIGLVISSGCNEQFKAGCFASMNRIKQINLDRIGYRLR